MDRTKDRGNLRKKIDGRWKADVISGWHPWWMLTQKCFLMGGIQAGVCFIAIC